MLYSKYCQDEGLSTIDNDLEDRLFSSNLKVESAAFENELIAQKDVGETATLCEIFGI